MGACPNCRYEATCPRCVAAREKRLAPGRELATLRAQLDAAVALLRQTIRLCECGGTGQWERSCTYCGDSTYDHNCNDEMRECTSAICHNARAFLSSLERRDD